MKTLHLCLALAVTAIAALAPARPSHSGPTFQAQWEADIQKFEAADRQNPPAKGGIVFVGSSSIVMWRTLKEDFPGYNVINRGFGGSQISDSLHFAERIVTPYEPKMVVLFAGTNDIANRRTANDVFADYQAFVAKVRAKLPDVRIAFIAITPAPSRWDKVEEMKKANQLVRDYTLTHDNLVYIDTFPAMLTPDGKPRPELFIEDQLHMNAAGYAIWKKIVGPYLPWGK